MRDRRLVFCHILLTSVYFSDKQVEDQPKSPVAASNVDPIPQETPWQEAEKPTEGLTVVARDILGCHSVLAVSNLCA